MKNRPVRKFKPVNPATILLVKQFIIGFLVFCFVGLIIAGVWYGTRLATFTVSAVNVSGGETIRAEAVHSLVEAELSGTYFGLIPKRFSFFYPKEAIVNSLGNVERLKDPQVSLLDKRTLEVSFDEYRPDALWCRSNEGEDCLFLDDSGYAFAVAPQLSGNSLIRYYSLNTDVKLKTRPVSVEDYQVTKEFVFLLGDSNWFVSKVEVDSTRDVFYILESGGEIKASLADGPLKPFTYLQTLLGSEDFKHLQPGNFKYLDLRFGTKIFVNEEVGAESEAEIDLPDLELNISPTSTTYLDITLPT
jgi:hypothetical protein